MAKLNAQLKEIQKLVELLGKDIDRLTFERLKTDSKFAAEYLKDLNEELNEAIEGTSNLASGFRSVQDELTQGKQSLRDMKSSMGSLKSLSQQIENIKNGSVKADSKSLEKLKEKLDTEKANIASITFNLNETKKILDKKLESRDISNTEFELLKDVNKALDEGRSLVLDTNESYNETVQTLKEINELNESIDKKLGSFPGLAAGLDKMLGKVGIRGIGFAKALEEAKAKTIKSGDATKIWSNYTTSLGNQFKKLLSPANILQSILLGILTTIINIDGSLGKLAKNLNLTYNQALEVRKELTLISQESNNSAITTERLGETLSSINSTFGTTSKISSENLENLTALRVQAGLTNQQILGIYGYSKLTGKSVKDSVNSFQATAKAASFQAGAALNTKVLMADIATTSKRLQISISGGEKGLAKAAVNAKLLGINLNDASAIADQLLNFESSIENELQAELLLGKNINLEKARQAALNNDMATVMSEITREAGNAEEFGNMNRIQQESLAKAVGMTVDGLSEALYNQQAIASLGRQLNDEEQRAFDTAKEKYGIKKATEMIEKDQLGNLVNQQSIAERFEDTVLQIKEIFVDIAQNVLPAIEPIFKGIAFVVGSIATGIQMFVEGLKKGSPLALALGAALIPLSLKLIGSAISAIYTGFAMLGPFGPPLALAAIAGMYSKINEGQTKVQADDIMSPGEGSSGYGKRTLFGPEGAIQLNNKDTVIAGTNLFGNDVKSEPGKATEMAGEGEMKAAVAPTTVPKVDMSQTNALLRELITAITTSGTVNLDGQKVGEALKIGSFQIQ